ncbi:MAG: ImmA/IrrE family metallo-endopeptidase [Streptococcaceae bacterium]|jgi:Zn-dependent peptidase ImmA (M78 family)|nr:ImmA/IrrE family metallo-endopeptidase [Streptococcaceae bacterium]
MNLERELEAEGISVVSGHGMDKDGLYLPDAKIIFINDSLDDIDRKNTILHELGHLINSHESLECEAPSLASKRELKADRYMIQARIEEYLADFDNQPDVVNIDNFLKAYHLQTRYSDLVIQLFHENL